MTSQIEATARRLNDMDHPRASELASMVLPLPEGAPEEITVRIEKLFCKYLELGPESFQQYDCDGWGIVYNGYFEVYVEGLFEAADSLIVCGLTNDEFSALLKESTEAEADPPLPSESLLMDNLKFWERWSDIPVNRVLALFLSRHGQELFMKHLTTS